MYMAPEREGNATRVRVPAAPLRKMEQLWMGERRMTYRRTPEDPTKMSPPEYS